jgi:hypothetical protein
MKKENIIEKLIQGVIFIVLLIIIYKMYMKTAIEQFTKGRTTISQTPKNLSKLKPPIFIFCPDPSFKHSFFKSHDIKSLGIEKYFWMDTTLTDYLTNKFENHSALDLYMKMSHQYGSDWKILILDFR